MLNRPDEFTRHNLENQKHHRIPTIWLSGIFVLLFLVILVVYFGIRNLYFYHAPVNWLDYLILALAFFTIGLTGVVYIVRREFPQVVIMKGTAAVIFGMFITVIGWGIAIYSLYAALKHIFG